MPGIFVTGIAADVGKTLVAAGVVYFLRQRGYGTAYYKPVATGCQRRGGEGFDWRERVGYHVYQIALFRGLLLRPLGNVLYFMPPYSIDFEEIAFMVDTTSLLLYSFLR